VPQFYYRYATRVPREAHAVQKRLGFCNAQANSLIVRKTKIICTLGPATEKTEALRQLIQKGTDIFRLNMSHAKHEWVRNIVPRIRRLAQTAGRPVAILLDTQGPAIRTGVLETDLHLKPGDILEFTVRGAKKKEQYSVDVNYPGFVKDVSTGDTVLVDNGLLKVVVLGKGKDRVRTKVLTPLCLARAVTLICRAFM
jgi:pyruvate kinase